MPDNIKLTEIHTSLINGQRRQMVNLIQEYGLYDFWNDYRDLLTVIFGKNTAQQYGYFTDATISYFRITNR